MEKKTLIEHLVAPYHTDTVTDTNTDIGIFRITITNIDIDIDIDIYIDIYIINTDASTVNSVHACSFSTW